MAAFIWDLDGTLIDSYGVFLTALSETFSNFNLPFERVQVYQFIKKYSVNELLKTQPVDFDLIKSSFTKKTTARNDEIKLMEGAKAILDWTKSQGIENFIYTHKGKNAHQLLEQLSISDYFIEVVTSEYGFPRKPNPAGVDYLLEKYRLDKSKTYYIGDRQLDIEVAHNSGIQSINFIKAEKSQKIEKLTDIIGLWEGK